jgi:hypothetical protein
LEGASLVAEMHGILDNESEAAAVKGTSLKKE